MHGYRTFFTLFFIASTYLSFLLHGMEEPNNVSKFDIGYLKKWYEPSWISLKKKNDKKKRCYCIVTYDDPRGKKDHMKKYHNDSNNSYFSDAAIRKRKKKPEEFSFRCDNCSARFAQLWAIEIHEERFHGIERPKSKKVKKS